MNLIFHHEEQEGHEGKSPEALLPCCSERGGLLEASFCVTFINV
jgi:hypothetical protein